VHNKTIIFCAHALVALGSGWSPVLALGVSLFFIKFLLFESMGYVKI